MANTSPRPRGFQHLDFETRDYRRYIKKHALWEARIEELTGAGRDLVITLGFPGRGSPGRATAARARLRMVLVDGDRTAARRAFVERNTIPEDALDVQMAEIAETLDPQMDSLVPIVVDVFDSQGQRRPIAELAAEVLGPR